MTARQSGLRLGIVRRPRETAFRSGTAVAPGGFEPGDTTFQSCAAVSRARPYGLRRWEIPTRRPSRGSSQSPGGAARAHSGGPVVDPRRGGPMHSLPARPGPGTCAMTSGGDHPQEPSETLLPRAIRGSRSGPPEVPAVRPRRKPPPMRFVYRIHAKALVAPPSELLPRFVQGARPTPPAVARSALAERPGLARASTGADPLFRRGERA